ncbi:nucleosidase [Acidithiobacillus sp.]|jgi:hopanoid-associated phosphorylase|uniref:phosphorylase family protein n=1 Tax=Acidithiobacillus sp. TaxID=1872118 RepID=UPI0025BF6BA5|nr:nucleosidase [Acidithiobacillus sp.]MCK9189325.1 nucleosidase [Acidithiobacillus sp.]MCK9359083.1 nucleosidase [Acidithiobacillus sp.]
MSCPRVGVVVALDAEARVLHAGALSHDAVIEIGERLLLCVSGMGPERATSAVCKLIAAGVEGVVSWGTAGALQPARKPGDLLLPETVFWSGQAWAVNLTWRTSVEKSLTLPVHGGGLLSVDSPCSAVATKSAFLMDYPSAQSVDMESGAIAAAAHAADQPFIVIRSVVDPADQSLPTVATGSVDAYGRPQALRFMRGLLRHPAELPALIRLGGQMQKALNTLRAVVPGIQAGRVA